MRSLTFAPGLPRFLFALGLAGLAGATPAPIWVSLPAKAPGLAEGTRAWADAPLCDGSLDSLQARGWTVRGASRWLNRASAVPPSDTASLPAGFARLRMVAKGRGGDPELPSGAARAASVDPAWTTLARMHDSLGVTAATAALARRGEEPGEGMVLAVLDDGFAIGHSVLSEASIQDAWDYVDGDSLPWETGSAPWTFEHGTATSGLVVSDWSTLPGVAPAASLLLYRTEDDATETLVEEDNLAFAIERAVEHGADVISISLGYRFYLDDEGDLPDSLFDGRTLAGSLAALEAARHGVLVVAASGNDALEYGSGSVGSPGDADSILTVGGIAESGLHCAFASWGPTWDGRLKPELSGYACPVPVAEVVTATDYDDGAQGTSYATPLVAGTALLLRQLRPSLSVVALRDALVASARQLDGSSADSVRGAGLPDLRRILSELSSVSSTGRLPGVWSLADGGLAFATPPDASTVDVDFFDPLGRRLHRVVGVASGGTLWDGTGVRSGLLLVRWSAGGATRSQRVIVLPARAGM